MTERREHPHPQPGENRRQKPGQHSRLQSVAIPTLSRDAKHLGVRP
jgi:hypothetical protein